MADKITKEEIQQSFFDIADEMEKQCGDWESMSKDEELTKRILVAVMEHEKRF